MHVMTMLDIVIEPDEDDKPQSVIKRRRIQFMDSEESLELYQLRIANHDTAGEKWRIFECELNDAGELSIGGEVTS